MFSNPTLFVLYELQFPSFSLKMIQLVASPVFCHPLVQIIPFRSSYAAAGGSLTEGLLLYAKFFSLGIYFALDQSLARLRQNRSWKAFQPRENALNKNGALFLQLD